MAVLRHGMDALSKNGRSYRFYKIIDRTGKSAITFDFVPIDEASNYAAEDADITIRLWKLFKPKLQLSKVTSLPSHMRCPLGLEFVRIWSFGY